MKLVQQKSGNQTVHTNWLERSAALKYMYQNMRGEES
jgi:hypothetical protein